MNSRTRLTNCKLFLDSSYPPHAIEVSRWLKDAAYAALDGHTTNPSYFTKKNPEMIARFEKGERFSLKQLMDTYKKTANHLEQVAPGEISVEVYADKDTPAKHMIEQARELIEWLPKPVIKLPITENGLIAAESLKTEARLNMTLCFSQAQAAAVYAATMGSKHPVYVSAFIGRLDDQGENGVQHVTNCLRMFQGSDRHVQVLAASFRRLENIFAVLDANVDALTVNYDRFKIWKETSFAVPDESFEYRFDGNEVPYYMYDLDADWRSFDLHHDLTEAGLQQFADDWNSLLYDSSQSAATA